MAAQGLRPYLVDWGTPNDEERGFDTTAYVARLERALAFVAKRARRAPAVLGYCMGGTLTVALAARQPRRVAGLALLAAPWDFHADRTGHAFLLSTGPLLAEVADKVGELPVDILQTLFWSLDPWLSVKKFGRFLGMDPERRPRARIRAARGLAERRRAAGRSDGARVPGRLVRRQYSRQQQVGRGRPSHRAVEDQGAVAGHDPVGRPHRAAAVGRGARRSEDGPEERDADRPAARPYRHGGERPRPRSVLDAADRLAARTSSRPGGPVSSPARSFDWRVPAIWAALLTVSVFAHTHVEIANETARGVRMSLRHGARDPGVQSSGGRGPAAGDLLAASTLADPRSVRATS